MVTTTRVKFMESSEKEFLYFYGILWFIFLCWCSERWKMKIDGKKTCMKQ